MHFLTFLCDRKDYANFDHAFSIIMNFLKPIGLETNSSLQNGNKSENSHWEKNLLNLKKDGTKIVKNLFFRTTLLILLNNWEGKYSKIPKMSLFERRIGMFYRHSIPADTETSQRRRENVLFLFSKTS